jgi:hypothetical protein
MTDKERLDRQLEIVNAIIKKERGNAYDQR